MFVKKGFLFLLLFVILEGGGGEDLVLLNLYGKNIVNGYKIFFVLFSKYNYICILKFEIICFF